MKRIASLLLLVCCSLGAFAQSKKLWLYHADEYYKNANYESALDYYMKVLDDSTIFDTYVYPYEISLVNQKLSEKKVNTGDSTRMVPLRDYIEHQIAMCYRNTHDYHHAVTYFKMTSDKGAYPHDRYNYATALMFEKRYAEAIENFEKYIVSDWKSDSLIKSSQKHMAGCLYAMDSSHVKQDVNVWLADTAVFNQGTSNFAPMFWQGSHKVVFTSARPGGVILDPRKQQSEYLCDLYWTEKEDSTWGPAHNFGRPVNTSLHDASGSFTADDIMYFTRWSDSKRKEQYIYLARMMNGLFFEALKLDSSVNVPGYRSINPFVSIDGLTLYYSSDRPGGKGGLDLWSVQLDEYGNPTGDPMNLGEPVNTPYDEVTPFYHLASSTLYFSSNGHETTGGLDVFKSAYDLDNEVFGAPVNMGMPINSPKDDAYLVWDRFLKRGFFASDRVDCESGHCYDIYEVTRGPITIRIEGFVYDNETEDIIPNALVTFKDVKGEMDPVFLSTDEEGFYSLELQREQEWFIKSQKVKYLADAASVNTYKITESTVIPQDFYLKKVPEGDVEIPGIEYDFDKATLRPSSEEILDKLYDFLALNDNLVVEINSHTDCRGNDAYNMRLSQARAQSCVDYLVKKGIARQRLLPKGYGESMPIPGHECEKVMALEKTDHDKFEEMHQKNRRTAFRVLKQDDPNNPVLNSGN